MAQKDDEKKIVDLLKQLQNAGADVKSNDKSNKQSALTDSALNRITADGFDAWVAWTKSF